MADMFGSPSARQVFIKAISKYVPIKVLEFVHDHSSSPRCVHTHQMKEAVSVLQGACSRKGRRHCYREQKGGGRSL
ncbi:hypothetical protein SERLA73DRAFT_86781 [Serpula lacrymans var. lacrymans S7.3]|uniref:Uncharacterized protein n=1 Tax=Serpula lacrymans var. lacrymans (strain S7.3) TaxID=936435 RepID=F8PRG3_SERL3|nr:hypothetical protein SERLA73DRAFT_86781 [Serpula lacrymans var. lacrymans S7.3]